MGEVVKKSLNPIWNRRVAFDLEQW